MTRASLSPPRVLVLTLSFGSGHVRAAAAITREIRRQSPDAAVELVDVLEFASPLFRAIYVWPYWAMLRFAPSLWRRLFASRLRRESRHTAPRALFRLGCRAVFARIREFRPDVIVAAEVGACEIAVAARRVGMTGAALVAAITDAQAEPAWVAPEVLHYAVPSQAVAGQLAGWGARTAAIAVAGIPIDSAFLTPVGRDDRSPESPRTPTVLLMGGGMGPTRMDRVAAALCESGQRIAIVAVTGKDEAARRRLQRLEPRGDCTLRVVGWTDDVAALMRAATLLVTKPGGLTIAEAAACGVPLLLFDPIPGPEDVNAAVAAAAGAAVLTHGSAATARAVLELLKDPERLRAMADAARATSRPSAAADIARIVLDAAGAGAPFVLLTIRNGAGHTRAAEAIAEALTPARAEVLDVADYFTFAARFTHVTAYLWLVRHCPSLWNAIDRAQKRRVSTSPAWYYRRGARRLFGAIARLQPAALAATEVGCCEIAALIKRDLRLACGLAAINAEYDADRAWIQPEVTQYAVAADSVASAFITYGAERSRIQVTGVPLHAEFRTDPAGVRHRICAEIDLDPGRPVILVAGGSEGLGAPDRLAEVLLTGIEDAQVVLLAGRSPRFRARAEKRLQAYARRVRVLGWTPRVSELMASADVLVSKLGHTFDEAIARRLPIVALPPPPGAERIQYDLLREWGVGRPVGSIDEALAAVRALLRDAATLAAARAAAATHARPDAALRIARWLSTAVFAQEDASVARPVTPHPATVSEARA